MSLIGIQRRLVQVGRIRMGEKVGGTGRPTKLERWRLTSRDQQRLQAAAEAFGGKVRPWQQREGEFELYTETDALAVLLMPGQTLTQNYESWTGGGCTRRCDGETEQLTDGPCLCDPEARECKPISRLNVLLPAVPGIGCWRLDSTGYYAASELAGAVDLLELATSRGVLLPARLRIDQRSALRDGQTLRFGVPTLDIDVRPLEMHQIARSAVAGEVAAAPDQSNGQTLEYKPIASLTPGVTLAEGLAAADAQTETVRGARSAAPIGVGGEILTTSDIPIPVESDVAEVTPQPSAAGQREGERIDREGVSGRSVPSDEIASSDQQKLLMATAREAGISDARRYDLTEQVCGEGIRSVKRVPRDKVDELLAAFNAPASLILDELVGKLQDYGHALGIINSVNEKIAAHEQDGPVEFKAWLEAQLPRLKQRYEEQQAPA